MVLDGNRGAAAGARGERGEGGGERERGHFTAMYSGMGTCVGLL